MCYTEVCDCTGASSSTSPTDINHCCSSGLNGVSYSAADGTCSSCPGGISLTHLPNSNISYILYI